MAEHAQGDVLGDAPKVKRLPVKKLILLILLPLLLLLGGAAGLMMSGLLNPAPQGQQKPAAETPADMPKKGAGSGYYATLSDFILTPRTASGESRFVMLTVSLHLQSQDENAKVKVADARVRDAIIVLLSRQPVETLSQPSAIEPLRAAIEAEVRRLLPDLKLYSAQITRLRVQ
ncbi:flagellar basal body-associated FliL family protein [Oceanibaculum pacificum]|uniref:Flagellar protein FliL n=1 Tax=Oceanibaculum pacificum TaxID=580166 RepID=A0A154VYV8_9PROT|nr:flagellar basal body-associated FliL family protein [Oceanibaculum pacificum]KZD06409.1 hypothetical protein AUP43_10825 [Oceanibaculum pacificum]